MSRTANGRHDETPASAVSAGSNGATVAAGPAGSVADQIRRRLPDLTPAERRVGRTLIAGYPVAGLSTVADLATVSATSSATVVRLVQKLGFEGYPQFQSSLRDELASRTSGPAARIDHGDSRWTEPGSLGRITEGALHTVGTIRETVPESEFEAAVSLLADRSRPAKLMGGRVTGLLAEFLHHHLSRARSDTSIFPTGPRERHSAVLDIRRRDVLLVLDVRRYDAGTVALAQAAAGRGATIVLLTDVFLSPVASIASVVLPVRVDAPSPFDTTVALFVLVEALATAVVAQLGAGAVKRMHEWDDLADAPAPPPSVNWTFLGRE